MKNKFIIILIIFIIIIITGTFSYYLFVLKPHTKQVETETVETIKPKTYDDYLKLTPLNCYMIEDISDLVYSELDEESLSFYGCQAVLMLVRQTDEVCIPVINKAWYSDNKINIFVHSTTGTQLYHVVLDQDANRVYVKKVGSVYHLDFPGLNYGVVGDGANYKSIEDTMIKSGLTDKLYTLISITNNEAVIRAADGEEHTIKY